MPDMPEAYNTFDRKSAGLERTVATLQVEHIKAFLNGAETALKGGDGLVDYTKLGDEGTRLAFLNAMQAVYGAGARRWLGLAPDAHWSDIQTVMGASGVYGIQNDQLLKLMQQQEARFTLDLFHGMLSDPNNGLLARSRASLGPTAYSHMTDADKAPVMAAMGLAGRADPASTPLERVIQYMTAYRASGVIPPRMLEE